jgi:hypothetical protein
MHWHEYSFSIDALIAYPLPSCYTCLEMALSRSRCPVHNPQEVSANLRLHDQKRNDRQIEAEISIIASWHWMHGCFGYPRVPHILRTVDI